MMLSRPSQIDRMPGFGATVYAGPALECAWVGSVVGGIAISDIHGHFAVLLLDNVNLSPAML